MPEDDPHQPHDKLFKASFSEPATAAAFLKTQLPPRMAASLEWDGLRVEAGSFIDERLRGSESDLLFRVGMSGQDSFLYLLFEHQREEDPWLGLRLLRYLTRIWEKFRQEQPEARQLPPVIPVVLAHNASRWTGSVRFHDLIALPEEWEADVLPLMPGFTYLLAQLAEIPFEKIAGTPLGVLTLRVMKAERAAQLLEDVVWEESLWLRLSPAEWRRLLRYIYYAGDVDTEAFERKVQGVTSREFRETAMTLAQQYRQKGLREGRKEGRQEEGRRLLRRLLQKRFDVLPDWVEERVDGASLDDLGRWSERVLEAVILQDVFAEGKEEG